MYEYYLTNALVGIINSKQALKNYQITKLKSLKNTSAYHIQQTFSNSALHEQETISGNW